jgi:hypothetical protein
MGNAEKMPLYMPGLDAKLLAEVEDRVEEFEREHEQDVLNGGNGYVDRIQPKDYMIAIAINAILGIYWVWSLVS